MELVDLLLGDVDLLQAGLDLGKGQESALLTMSNQPAKLIELRNRRFVVK